MEDDVDAMRAVLPAPTVDSRPFWDACNADALLLQRCGHCAHLFYYARRLCPACGGTELRWEPSAGRGSVYSFSEVHVAFHGSASDGRLPYTVVLIDLDEGPRMLSRWVPGGAASPAVGQRAVVRFTSVSGQKLPFFTAERD